MKGDQEGVDGRRVRAVREAAEAEGPVLYWMSRDQRASDNWALLYAQEVAAREGRPLGVVFCLVPEFLGGTKRQYAFMLRGLEEVCGSLEEHAIRFFLVQGDPHEEIPELCRGLSVASLVTDFSPLRIKRDWLSSVSERLECSLYEVDAHNIVPCWLASPKLEYAAYTLRPKINRSLAEYLTGFPDLASHPHEWDDAGEAIDWDEVEGGLSVDETVGEVDWVTPGETAGREKLIEFVDNDLSDYAEARNDPNEDVQSGLSPYLHFGQLSAQRVALEVKGADAEEESKEAFLEEVIVRRELSDNFCYYSPDYDNTNGFHDWARKTLQEHREDEREYLYSLEEFEAGDTHDELWNAAEMEMVKRGKMHGYMRMYWAKKILEWTESPEQAMEFAIYLNDRYELDGRDPNGYTGVAWSIGGVHDRAWAERPVFGKIRFMSRSGCERKFDVERYVSRVEDIQ
jgi:deoxyribodipyrimidine photo-lyase